MRRLVVDGNSSPGDDVDPKADDDDADGGAGGGAGKGKGGVILVLSPALLS